MTLLQQMICAMALGWRRPRPSDVAEEAAERDRDFETTVHCIGCAEVMPMDDDGGCVRCGR